jgi:hypothetical protein
VSSMSQINANRLNAKHANGATTPEGQATSSKNAMKHGLLSKDMLLPDEDPEALATLAQGLDVALAPVGRLETILVNRIISLRWRLRRMAKAERAILTSHQVGILGMNEIAWEDIDQKEAEEKTEAEFGATTPSAMLDPDLKIKLGDWTRRQNREHPVI